MCCDGISVFVFAIYTVEDTEQQEISTMWEEGGGGVALNFFSMQCSMKKES